MAENENLNPENKTPENADPAKDAKPTPSIEELTKQIETLTAAMAKQKQALDNASSDAADWKRKYRSTMDDAARAEEERKEADAKKDALIAQLTRSQAITDYTAQYIAMGYSPELARASAEAYQDGDFAKVMALQKQHQGKIESDVKARLINQQPGLTPGITPSGVGVEDPALTAFRRGLRGK